MCKGIYEAIQGEGKVVILAAGFHPSDYYKTWLEKSLITKFPPEYILKHKKPGGMAPPVFTPFLVRASFEASDPVKAVTVHDANGSKSVPVTQIKDV